MKKHRVYELVDIDAKTIYHAPAPGLEVYLAADVEEVLKDAKILAEWVAEIPGGTPLPLAEARRLLEKLR